MCLSFVHLSEMVYQMFHPTILEASTGYTVKRDSNITPTPCNILKEYVLKLFSPDIVRELGTYSTVMSIRHT